MKTIIVMVAVLFAFTVGADAVSLEKRHQLGLRMGVWSQTNDDRTEVGIGGVATSVGNSGAMGGVFYSHWLSENAALSFAIEGMSLDINTSIDLSSVESTTSSVGAMLMGVKYYFARSTLENTVRPYFRGGAGTFIGSQSKHNVGLEIVNEERTEVALGGQVGFGLDVITGRHFMIGFSGVYNLMSDFGDPIGGSKNYSGPGFGFEFSWLFGKGVE